MSACGLFAQLPPPPAGRTGWPWTEETSSDRYATLPASGQWPKLSIVCPSFRQGGFIEETLRSVLLQNYPALEFIVIDGGSNDETVPILKKYAPWLAHWESEPDRGQSHALNKGFTRATGDLFGWINSDDYYQPGALAAIAAGYRPGRRELFFGNYEVRVGGEPTLRRVRLLPAFAFQVRVGGRILPSHATFWPRSVHCSLSTSRCSLSWIRTSLSASVAPASDRGMSRNRSASFASTLPRKPPRSPRWPVAKCMFGLMQFPGITSRCTVSRA